MQAFYDSPNVVREASKGMPSEHALKSVSNTSQRITDLGNLDLASAERLIAKDTKHLTKTLEVIGAVD